MTFNLADVVDPGKDRVWWVEHRPVASKPVRLELREKILSSDKTRIGFTRIIGRIDTIADEMALEEAARDLMDRASKSDLFVGIHERGADRS